MQRRALVAGGLIPAVLFATAPVAGQGMPRTGDLAPQPSVTAIITPEAMQPAMPLEEPVDPERYIVGPGDVFTIHFWGAQNLTAEAAVGPEGRLFVPRAGVVEARGLTLAALRARVVEILRRAYPRLEFGVELLRPRSFLVTVTGAVASPGSYVAMPHTRVSQVIAQAAGVGANGSWRRIEVRRLGRAEPILADLIRARSLGALEVNPRLLDGDALFVPTRRHVVSVQGAVARPGDYELIAEGDVAEALEVAGGITVEAARVLPLRLERAGRPSTLVEVARPGAGERGPRLAEGDRLYVPLRAEEQAAVLVRGALAAEGRFGFDAIAAKGAGDKRLDTSSVAPDVVLSIPWTRGLTAGLAVLQAGGLLPWADGRHAYLERQPKPGATRARVPIDLHRVILLRDRGGDVTLEPGDELYVPGARADVVVTGAVARPGLYRFDGQLAPLDYVRIAGGALRSSDVGDARVVRAAGGQRLVTEVTRLQPGDTVVVPEKSLYPPEWINLLLVLSNLAIVTSTIYLQTR